MTPEQLRASILQYAMQGKLTDQRPEDGSVDDLLAQIAAEKEQLILDKKIKRDKELPPISEDEVPFQIPANWKWVTLADITTQITDGSHNPPKNSGSGYQIISAKNLVNGEIDFTASSRFMTAVDFEKENKRTNIMRGDVLLSIVGSIGKTAIVDTDVQFTAQRSVSVIKPLIVLNKYLKYVLDSHFTQEFMQKHAAGTAQRGIYLNTVKQIIIPLPPLAEQERIVDKLDMLETKINEYALRYEKIQLLDSELKPKLRESILYEIAAGKLNSGDTDNSPSSDTDTPFDVPVNWKWVTLSEIAEISLGKTPDSRNARYWASGKFPWISISDMQNGKVSETTQKQITQAAIDEKMGAISPKGTLILSFKLSIGKVAILPTDMYHNEAIASIFIKDAAVLKEWLYVILPKMVQYAEVAGAVKGNTLNKKKLSNLLIPVPDLETQTKLVHVWSSVQNYI